MTIRNIEMDIVLETKLMKPIKAMPGDTVEVQWSRLGSVRTVAKYGIEEEVVGNYAGIFKLPGGGYGGYISAHSLLEE